MKIDVVPLKMPPGERILWPLFEREVECSMGVKRELLEILACPACHGEVSYDEEQEIIQCQACRRQYPVRDDIPVMLIEEAKIAPEEP